jgi:hypothetical protein
MVAAVHSDFPATVPVENPENRKVILILELAVGDVGVLLRAKSKGKIENLPC